MGVNIRGGPGTGYSRLGAYAYGTVVAVTAAQGGWGQTAKGLGVPWVFGGRGGRSADHGHGDGDSDGVH